MGIVALSILVFDRTGSALATAGLFLGTRFLPALLAPILVARVEQPPPRFALPVIYCGEAAAFGGLALTGHPLLAGGVIVLATIDGALALTGRSLTRAVVAALLEPDGRAARGQRRAQRRLHRRRGDRPRRRRARRRRPSASRPPCCSTPPPSTWSRWILLTAGPLPQVEPEAGDTRERVRAGLAYIREQPTLRRLLLAQGAAFVFFAAVIPIEVIYAKQTLGAGDSGYGLMLASWGVGMVLGSLVFAAVAAGAAAHPALLQHRSGRRRLPWPRGGAQPGARLRCLGRRRHRQRRPVGCGDQRRARADRSGYAGAGDERCSSRSGRRCPVSGSSSAA